MRGTGGPPAQADVELRGITKRYGPVVAVASIDLEIHRGEFLSLLGPSGSGKTTVLRMIAGLIDPTAGEIHIRGRDVSRIPVHKRGLAMMFQNYSLFPHMTVAQNVAFGLEMHGVAASEITRRVGETVELVRLVGLERRYPRELSGGQQQRVALARCLAIGPAVLLLDEPLAALDKKLRETMEVELRALQRQLEITTIFVTHDQEEALTPSDRIAIMNEGRLEQIGPPLEVYERPATRFVSRFVGVCNFLDASWDGRGDRGEVFMRTAGGLRLGFPETTPVEPPGTRLTVAVRPEKISMSRATIAGETNAATGRVANVVYLGQITQYEVHLDTGEPLVVVQQNSDAHLAQGPIAAGERVWLQWAPEANRILLA